MNLNIGILHPGEMGISIAVSAQQSGYSVYWLSQKRSDKTIKRAEKYNLIDAGSLGQMCEHCQVIISVCPPHAAEEVASEVIANNFHGLYLDANAISPQRAIKIGQRMTNAGIIFVDGGIVGGPAWQPNSTWMHLSGQDAARIATIFEQGFLETNLLSNNIGDASALKMCFAAYTKGQTALLCAILGASQALGVRQALADQWTQIGFDLAEEAPKRARRVTSKAWRFAAEMQEIASTFESVGLPGGFHQAAADIYERLAGFKDSQETPTLDQVLDALVNVSTLTEVQKATHTTGNPGSCE